MYVQLVGGFYLGLDQQQIVHQLHAFVMNSIQHYKCQSERGFTWQHITLYSN